MLVMLNVTDWVCFLVLDVSPSSWPVHARLLLLILSHFLDASSQILRYFKYLLVSVLLMAFFKVRPSSSCNNVELTMVIGKKAFAVWTGGFYIVNLSQIAPALQVLYMVMVSNYHPMEKPSIY